MIELDRRKKHKWILQKNISSNKIIQSYLDVLSNNSEIDYASVQQQLRENNIYKGRSCQGSLGTMGVRFSQMCFYMFGYKVNNVFVPSPMTENLLNPNSTFSNESNSLINLFSMQFPHPNSETPSNFKIYMGRLIIKLLLDERIQKRLYIDEIIWFLPFLETITLDKYNELIESILEYRQFGYQEKLELFRGIRNYDDVFSNTTHEINNYFLRIFQGFGVLDIVKEETHNDGHLFRFIQGDSKTPRTDAYASRKKVSGYVKLTDAVLNDAIKLNDSFSAFDEPTTMETIGINSNRDWLTALYETEPLSYLNCINNSFNRVKEISDCINTMVHASKYGSRDGSEFEHSLKPVIELFRETCNVEIIAGAGNTDLLCAMEDENEDIYKMNVDAKTRKAGLEEINARRLEAHLAKHGSRFCIVVAPRFASGVSDDIKGHKIVTIKAEDLGAYCYKECTNSKDGFADFESVHKIIQSNMGIDITDLVRDLTASRYGISI